MNYSNLNWGHVNNRKTFFHGCEKISCESHGGIVIEAHILEQAELFCKLRNCDLSKFLENNVYVFEEDLEAHIILACLPHQSIVRVYPNIDTPNKYKLFIDGCHQVLKQDFPEIFTQLTGVELSIFESYKLMQDHLSSRAGLFKYDYVMPNSMLDNGMKIVAVCDYQGGNTQLLTLDQERIDAIKYPKSRLGYFPIPDEFFTFSDQAKLSA